MKTEKKNEPIFPDYGTLLTFIAYIVFFLFQGILVTASRNSENAYEYNTIAAVLATELVKLFISLLWYLQNRSLIEFWSEIRSNIKVLGLYFVPSTLYCVYNNLSFINLQNFDPTTYFLLLQFRVVITGLIYQCFFHRQLTAWQWFSLIVLTVGCIIKNMGHMLSLSSSSSKQSSVENFFLYNLFLLLIQVFCSCLAGVYNEFLLKRTGVNLDIRMHNIFMYTDSIICNIAALYCVNQSLKSGESSSYSTIDSFVTLLRPTIIAVIINNALCGIVTSVFLKKLNSILKVFASSLELVFLAVLCRLIFSIPIDIYTTLSIVIVTYATYIYLKQPIKLEPSSYREALASTRSDGSNNNNSSISSTMSYFKLKNHDDDDNYCDNNYTDSDNFSRNMRNVNVQIV